MMRFLPNTVRGLFTNFIRICICFIAIAYSANSLAITIDKIVVFGDSLSDNGNIYKRTIEIQKYISIFPVIPLSPPYYEGQFSNGSVWTDHVARAFHLDIDNADQYSNYAYGGARAEPGYDLYNLVIPAIEMQIGAYTTYYMFDVSAKDHLYIVWIGANDYLAGRDDVEAATNEVIARIKTQLEALITYGARYLVVMNLPNFANTPYAKSQTPAFAHNLEQLAARHNAKLAAMLEDMQKKNTEIKIIHPDINVYLNDVLTNPAKYNIKNVTEACYPVTLSIPGIGKPSDKNEILSEKDKIEKAIMANPQLMIAHAANLKKASGSEPPPCINSKEYLFWDLVHPTGVAHEYLANFVMDILRANDIRG